MKQENGYRCPFCSPEHVILGNDLGRVIADPYPVSPGHLLVIPYRHCVDFFGLTAEERVAMWELLSEARAYLQEKYQPDGFNIGVNLGSVAGQSIEHVHIHLMPRYAGDMRDPLGGVRGILPARRKYPRE